MTLTIKAKLTLGIVTVVTFIVGLGMFALQVQDRLNTSIRELEIQEEKIALVSDLRLAVEKSLMPGNDYLITGNGTYAKEFHRLNADVESVFAAIGKNRHFAPSEQKSIERAHVWFQGVRDISRFIFSKHYRAPGQPELMEKMDYQYAAPLIAELGSLNDRMRLSFGKAKTQASELRRASMRTFLIAISIIAGMLCVAGFSLRRSISRSLDALVGMLQEIAEGRGDLTKRITIQSRDEMGKLGLWFNRFIEQIQAMVYDISAVSREISSSSGAVRVSAKNVHGAAQVQFTAIHSTSSSTEQLNASITTIADDVETLQGSLATASSSSQEIATALTEVAELTENLDNSADKTLAAVNEIAASFAQVAEHVEVLSLKTDEVAASAMQINTAAKEINVCSQDQALMAQTVKEDAHNLGLSAIIKSKERMEQIRVETAETTEVMGHLGAMSVEISRIVSIISEIADRTKLLALNASILAAQAGVHGKGFGVVAEEIKELALQTANSTKEITTMVKQVQDGTATAIAVAKRSSLVVDDGVRLSLEAEAALNEIIKKTELSLQNSLKVARAAEEQTNGIGVVTESLQRMNFMVMEINRAAFEQKKSSEAILHSTEEMRGYTMSVRKNVTAQSEETQHITNMIQNVFEMARTIARTTFEQQKASGIIVQAFDTINLKAEENIPLAQDLDGIVTRMEAQADLLNRKIGTFRI